MSTQSILFDAPGPKARARHRILTIVGIAIALVLVWLVVGKMRDRLFSIEAARLAAGVPERIAQRTATQRVDVHLDRGTYLTRGAGPATGSRCRR